MSRFSKVPESFQNIKDAMIADDPSALGSYAHGWHCNIAMAVYDSFEHIDKISKNRKHEIGNEAASRFMKILFDVETTNEGKVQPSSKYRSDEAELSDSKYDWSKL
jgi:hypothetical protein